MVIGIQNGPTSAPNLGPPRVNVPPGRRPGQGLLGLLPPLRHRALRGLFEPIARLGDLEDVAAVGQPVEQGGGHPLPLEHLPPLAEGHVAREQHTAPLVPLAEHLEQELGPLPREREVAQLVQDQQVQALKLLPQPIQLIVSVAVKK